MGGISNILLGAAPNYPVVTGFNTNEGIGTVPLNITRPGAASGAFQIFFGACDTSGVTWTGGTGYTEILDDAGVNSLRMAWRLTSGDGATAAFNSTSPGATIRGILAAFSQGTIGNVGAVAQDGAVAAFLDVPGIMVPAAGTLLAFFYSSNTSEFYSVNGALATNWTASKFVGTFNNTLTVLAKPVWPGATGTMRFVPSILGGNLSGVLVSVSGG